MKEDFLKTITVIISLAALVWGGATFLISQKIDAHRPYLEYQLELYKETAQAAVTISTTSDKVIAGPALRRFCELFFGELALVETPKVEAAMIRFMTGLGSPSTVCTGANSVTFASRSQRTLSLNLAHALRNSLAESWNVDDWKYAPTTPNE